MKKNTVVLFVGIIQVISSLLLVQCIRLADRFYFSAFDLKFSIDNGTKYDVGLPIYFVKIFHNKVTGFLLDLFTRYIDYFDLIFLISIFSFVGLLGVIWGVVTIYRKRMKRLFPLIFIIFLLPIVEIFAKDLFPVQFKIFVINILFLPITYTGVKNLLHTYPRAQSIILLLGLLSLWWLVIFGDNLKNICII